MHWQLQSTWRSISVRTARSLSDHLVDEATLVLAIDSGTARVARLRFPTAAARIHTLGELAGRDRDIPDPFKMQIGPWLVYTRGNRPDAATGAPSHL